MHGLTASEVREGGELCGSSFDGLGSNVSLFIPHYMVFPEHGMPHIDRHITELNSPFSHPPFQSETRDLPAKSKCLKLFHFYVICLSCYAFAPIIETLKPQLKCMRPSLHQIQRCPKHILDEISQNASLYFWGTQKCSHNKRRTSYIFQTVPSYTIE